MKNLKQIALLLACFALAACATSSKPEAGTKTSEQIRKELIQNGRSELTVSFASGSAVISAEGSLQAMEIAKALEGVDFRRNVALIVGHTDSQGSDDYNLSLSRERALAVVDLIVSTANINRDHIRWEGRGERELKVRPELTEVDRAANRRVEVQLIPRR